MLEPNISTLKHFEGALFPLSEYVAPVCEQVKHLLYVQTSY